MWKPSPTATLGPRSCCGKAGAKVRKRTLANLTDRPAEKVDALRRVLEGRRLISPEAAFTIERPVPHGHVELLPAMVRRLGLGRPVAPKRSPERDRVAALVVERPMHPASKRATMLAGEPDPGDADGDAPYRAMNRLLARRGRIAREAARHTRTPPDAARIGRKVGRGSSTGTRWPGTSGGGYAGGRLFHTRDRPWIEAEARPDGPHGMRPMPNGVRTFGRPPDRPKGDAGRAGRMASARKTSETPQGRHRASRTDHPQTPYSLRDIPSHNLNRLPISTPP